MKTLYLLRGVPGCGKSTLAAYLQSIIGDERSVAVSADDFMFANGQEFDRNRLTEVHERCLEKVLYLMSSEVENIFLHNTMTREWEFDKYQFHAKRLGYRVFSLIVENRHEGKSVHSMPEDAYERYEDRFEIRLHKLTRSLL